MGRDVVATPDEAVVGPVFQNARVVLPVGSPGGSWYQTVRSNWHRFLGGLGFALAAWISGVHRKPGKRL